MLFRNWDKETSWQGKAAWLGRWALLLAFAALPVKGELVPLPLAVGTVLLLPQTTRFGKLRDKGLLLLPVAFYLLHVLGMSWSTDKAFGLFDLEVKLSLLLIPLVAAGMRTSDGKDLLRPAMVAFSVGLLLAILISMHSALTCYGTTGWVECFTQSYLSAYLHPSYMAWYACWTLFYWGYMLIDGQVTGLRARLAVAFLPLLIIFIVMLVSKSGLLGLALALLALLARAARKLPRRTFGLLMIALAVSCAIPGVLLSRVLSVRVGEAVHAVKESAKDDPSVEKVESSTDERLTVWGCSLQSIQASPWGAGTGDIKHVLMECYREKGAEAAIAHRLNSHSQVLQSGVALGWPGMLLVAALMLVPLIVGMRRKDPFLAIFALLFILNGAIESVLEVQAGVVFFILFFVTLVHRPRTIDPKPIIRP
jgi:O-antigen ligase